MHGQLKNANKPYKLLTRQSIYKNARNAAYYPIRNAQKRRQNGLAFPFYKKPVVA